MELFFYLFQLKLVRALQLKCFPNSTQTNKLLAGKPRTLPVPSHSPASMKLTHSSLVSPTWPWRARAACLRMTSSISRTRVSAYAVRILNTSFISDTCTWKLFWVKEIKFRPVCSFLWRCTMQQRSLCAKFETRSNLSMWRGFRRPRLWRRC